MIEEIAAGSTGIIPIIDPGIAITQVSVTVKNALRGLKVTVASFAQKPVAIPEVQGIVYQYLELKKENAADSDIAQATIKFIVPERWVSEHASSPSAVALYRYRLGWDKLPTTPIGAGEGIHLYESVSPGLSYFAIGVENPAVAKPQPQSAPSEPEKQPASAEGTTDSRWLLFVALTALVFAVLAIVHHLQKKHQRQTKRP